MSLSGFYTSKSVGGSVPTRKSNIKLPNIPISHNKLQIQTPCLDGQRFCRGLGTQIGPSLLLEDSVALWLCAEDS